MMKPEISIVVPIYNEEDSVTIMYKELKKVLIGLKKRYEIILIDDGSTDKTFNKLLEISKKDKNIRIIKFRKNFGQTAAFDAGFKNSKGEVIVSMDADLQNDPKDIPLLLNKLKEGFDAVNGWRFNRKDSLSKRLPSNFANWLRKILTKDKINDAGCSLRAYKKDCFKDIDFYGEMHRFIPSLLFWKGYKVAEVKVNHRKRKYGRTKYSLNRLIRGFLDLLVVKFWMQYSARPIHLFGGGGLLLFSLGFLLGIILVIGKLFFGITLANRTSPLLAVLLVILGIQFLVSGIIADISIKSYYKNKQNYSIEKIVNKFEK